MGAKTIIEQAITEMPVRGDGTPFTNLMGINKHLRAQGYEIDRTPFGKSFVLRSIEDPNAFVEFDFNGGGGELAAAIQRANQDDFLAGIKSMLSATRGRQLDWEQMERPGAVNIEYNSLFQDVQSPPISRLKHGSYYGKKGFRPHFGKVYHPRRPNELSDPEL
jgi:hypothetical protein